MLTNQNGFETGCHYADQSEWFWNKVSLWWPIRMVLRQVVIMMTNQNSLETEYHYNDQLELFWGRVLLCWPIRTILRQGVIMLTNQNHFETKCHCADQSEALIMLLFLLVDIYIFLCMCMYTGTCMEGRGETVGMGFSSYHVCSQGPDQGVSQSLPTELSPQVHILNVSFPPPQVFLAPSIERI